MQHHSTLRTVTSIPFHTRRYTIHPPLQTAMAALHSGPLHLPRVSDAECNGNACQALPVWSVRRRWGIIYATSSCNIAFTAAMEHNSSFHDKGFLSGYVDSPRRGYQVAHPGNHPDAPVDDIGDGSMAITVGMHHMVRSILFV